VLWLTVEGRGPVPDLTAALAEVDGVITVASDDGNAPHA
jgi:hypothetical protein